jgi:hypothetical protein
VAEGVAVAVAEGADENRAAKYPSRKR